jgi:periplasmic protein TonB
MELIWWLPPNPIKRMSITEYIKDNHKRNGIIGTVIFHLILLLLFIFFGLKEPFPRLEEMGMPIKIRLGATETGKNKSNEFTPPNSEKSSDPVKTPETNVNPNIATQDQSPISVKKTEDKKTENPKQSTEAKVEQEKKEEEKQISEHLKKMLEKFKNPDKSGGNSGNTGDQGKPEGDPDGNPTGSAGKGGISYSLSGRGFMKPPKMDAYSDVGGTVIVEIIVDRNGNVIRATPGIEGTTTTDPVLIRKAKEGALQTKFTENPNAPFEQRGTMTFSFILK